MPRRYPRRVVAALTGVALLFSSVALTLDLLLPASIWRLLYAGAGLQLLIIAVTPNPGVILRASANTLATLVLAGRATGLILGLLLGNSPLPVSSTLIAAMAWLTIMVHTQALLMFWRPLEGALIQRSE